MAALYRSRSNQPKGYSGVTPKVYRCKNHDYVHYDHPWTDETTGQEYKAGYYDEEGNFYEDIVFSKQGKILDATTAVCKCDYCRMEDSRPWVDREKPCTHCGGTMSLVSQVDDLTDEPITLEKLENAIHDKDENKGAKIGILIIILLILSPCLLGIIAIIGESIVDLFTGHSNTASLLDKNDYYDSNDSYYDTYDIPNLGLFVYVKEEDGAYVITDEADYTSNYRDGGYKSLSFDSDGNYYDKETDMYVYLNEYIDPPQFQYWLEGLSSEYGDYGWMEYDAAEKQWYIEVDNDDWQPLSDSEYEEFKDRLWYINYNFYK